MIGGISSSDVDITSMCTTDEGDLDDNKIVDDEPIVALLAEVLVFVVAVI